MCLKQNPLPTYTVAIVGRPNVGKSTLFNRLVGKRLALIHDEPGMTRDRREGQGHLYDLSFTVIDTAGLGDSDGTHLTQAMKDQTFAAIAQADLVFFVIDGRKGCTPYDRDLAKALRRQKTPILMLANKCEGQRGQVGISDALSLGLGDVVAISAEHGEGLPELYDALSLYMPIHETESVVDENVQGADHPLHLAIVGRPNVGKSTLVNQFVGQDRVLSGDMPGMTRDAITLEWTYQNHRIRLTDTAGIRKSTRRTMVPAEHLAIMDTRRVIQYAQVVVVLIDATVPFERQDLTIASYIAKEGRALVLALNKWDLVKDKNKCMTDTQHALKTHLAQIQGVPCIPISAAHGKNLNRLMEAVFQVYGTWNKRLPTAKLNQWLQKTIGHHAPPAVRGRRIRIKYITQAKVRPPTFVLFANQADELPASYIRYLTNQLRQDFDLFGVPLRISARSGKNPYVDNK